MLRSQGSRTAPRVCSDLSMGSSARRLLFLDTGISKHCPEGGGVGRDHPSLNSLCVSDSHTASWAPHVA